MFVNFNRNSCHTIFSFFLSALQSGISFFVHFRAKAVKYYEDITNFEPCQVGILSQLHYQAIAPGFSYKWKVGLLED